MFLAALILLSLSEYVSSVMVVPALGWSFALGTVVGVVIWHVPLVSSAVPAAIRGALIGPLSLLAALASSTIADAVLGNLKEIEDIWLAPRMIAYLVTFALGFPIVILSALSGMVYAFIEKTRRGR